MKIHKIGILSFGALTLLAFVLSVIFQYYFCSANYWVNVCLAIFGSSFLALLISIIGYKVERQKTLETFSQYASRILNEIERYSTEWSLDRKVKYVLDLIDYDTNNYKELGNSFASIRFLFFHKRNFAFISKKIYAPIHDFLNDLLPYRSLLRKYDDCPAEYKHIKNDKELEKIINAELKGIDPDEDINEKMNELNSLLSVIDSGYFKLSIEPKIFAFPSKQIREVLWKEFFILMYGRKYWSKTIKLKEDAINNGKT